MKVAVLGAGAIGAYVGAALHRAGADAHLIARGPHLAAMRRYGVRVLRGEYPRAIARLRHAIGQARARGLLGDDVLGQG